MTHIANINSDAPNYVTSPEGFGATGANAALAQYLGDKPLTPVVLSQIIEAGVRAMARAEADSLALGLTDARKELSEEMSAVRASIHAEREAFNALAARTREELAAAAAQGTSDAHAVATSAVEATQRFITTLPETARQQLAPQIEVFRETLTTEAARVMDPTNGSAGGALHRSVQQTLDNHFDRIGSKFAELETKLGVAEARAEEREFSNRKGFDFENDLEELLAEYCERVGLVVRATGTKVGYVKRSTKGDFVIFSEDGETPLVCIEAKNKTEGTSTAEKHRDMDEMLRNRGCSVGVWVTKGREQNKGDILTVLSGSRWSFALEEDTESIFTALLNLAVATARRGAGSGGGNVEVAREKIQDAVTAAADFELLQRDAQQVVKAADTLSARTISLRTRIQQALSDAAAALSDGKESVPELETTDEGGES